MFPLDDDDLQYRVELWETLASREVYRVLSASVNVGLASAAYFEAIRSCCPRMCWILMRQGARVMRDSRRQPQTDQA